MKKKTSKKLMKLYENEKQDDPEFPDSYEVIEDIKSPLNVLHYNLNYRFSDKYPAKMPIDFAKDMILLYSKEGDIVWDGMCGSGTVPLVADALGRIGIGSDINPQAIDLCIKHDPENRSNYQVCDVVYASSLFKEHFKPRLIVTSPPFGLKIIGDKNNYSDEPKDVSHSKTMVEFLGKMKYVFQSYFDNLEAGGIMIVDGRDRTKDSIYYDMAVEFRNLALSVGFELVCKYWYELIPWSTWTTKHKPTRFVLPMPTCVEAYVMYKPKDSILQ